MAKAPTTKRTPRPTPPPTPLPAADLPEARPPWAALNTELLDIGDLKRYARNSRTHSPEQVRQIADAMLRFGWTNRILRRGETGEIAAGHGRLDAAQLLVAEGHAQFAKAPVATAWGWSEEEFRAYVIWDNRSSELAGWDLGTLRLELEELKALDFDIALTGFADLAMLDSLPGGQAGGGGGGKSQANGVLAEKFGVPPFTVLNARDGWWQDRKRAWIALGLRSEIGRAVAPGGAGGVWTGTKADGSRAAPKAYIDGGPIQKTGTEPDEINKSSIFDPVLCELVYRWFSAPGGIVLDPFAGGSVRGLVASKLGRRYVGMDLSAEQIDANRAQAPAFLGDLEAPVWVAGDSTRLQAGLAANGLDTLRADLVFTCPPYADLEVYSDDPADLSAMPYDRFRDGYAQAIAQACQLLRKDRFAVVVVGEVRAPDGAYRNFVGHTVEAFQAAGLSFYNEAILVTAIGSLPQRTTPPFVKARKLGKTHQNILVFVKGDFKAATEACGAVEFGELAPGPDDAEPEPEPRQASPAPPKPPPAPPSPRPVPKFEPAAILTPVDQFGAWWAKREDQAGFTSPMYPSGAKVRQFGRMAAEAPGAPMVVGCSADSAMQIYIAAAAHQLGVPAHVFVPARKQRTAATDYAISMGAEVTEVRPGHLSVCKARARAKGKELGTVVRWDPHGAIIDTMGQVANLPEGVRRIVVPVGSGAICAGIVAGLAHHGRTDVGVLGVKVSDMTDFAYVLETARRYTDAPLPPDVFLLPPRTPYGEPTFAKLPDGAELDPFYAAKALDMVRDGDCLWAPGLRPRLAFPAGR